MDARSPLGAVKEILVVHVSRIGDTLLATPAIRALANAFPSARITCLAHPKRAEILAGLPFVHRLGAITKQRAAWRGRLGGKRYDLAVVFGYDKPLVAYALRVARRVVAYRQGDARIDGRLFRVVDPPAQASGHAIDPLLSVTAALGIPPAGRHLSYSVSADEARWAERELAPLRARGAEPVIGLQIASFPTKAYRDWPVGHFVELCHRVLADHPGAHFLLFGGGEEQDRTRAVEKALRGHATHYAGRLSLRQTAALMDRLDLYIGVDTGPTHIMGALHRPMLAMYHGCWPSRVFAPQEHPCLFIIDHPRTDRGCTAEDSMAEIPVEAAYAKVCEALRIRHGSSSSRGHDQT